MNYEEFLNNKRQEQNKKNLIEFNKYINSRDGKKKVANFLERNKDLNVQNILSDALNGNPYAIAILRKDPTKQNISENSFFEFTGLEKLPQSGPNRVVLGNSKAADFKVKGYYGTQKYIKESGGAQDNQINDAVLFVKECIKHNQKAIVCIDGDYGKSRINKLLTNSDNCIILTADKLKEGLENGRFEKDTTFQ